MAGAFEGKGDWRLGFVEASVLMTCAGLHPEQHTYSIALKDNRAVITIQSTPKPVVLTISPEGLLTAPGPIVVNGSLSAGSRQETNYDGSTTTKYLYHSASHLDSTQMRYQDLAGTVNAFATKQSLSSPFSCELSGLCEDHCGLPS